VRLFFAVELPEHVQAALGRLRPSEDNGDYRWVNPALLHVTLAFLGEQPEERLAALHEIGAAAAQASRPGVLRLGRVGQFGGARSPRVLWVDLAGDGTLGTLQEHLASALSKGGFPKEERVFRAHITLARRRETARGGPPRGWPLNPPLAEWALEHLTLMQSRLSPRGPTYTALSQFALGG
jgi:RNA 2',3'-cyclic 3'-phosphodiesterase